MENLNMGHIVLIALVVVPLAASMFFSKKDIERLKHKKVK